MSFGAVLISLALMRTAELYPAQAGAPGEAARSGRGCATCARTPELLIPLVMIAVIGTLAWEFQVTLPLMASKIFHGGAAAYGVMASVMGVGAVVGGLISASRPRPRARALCLAAIGWGIAILAAAVAPNLPLELAAHGLRRLRQHHVQLLRQDHPAARGQADHARPGHGAVGAGLAGLDADRRADRRLGRPGRPAPAGRWSSAGCRPWSAGSLALPALNRIDRRRAAQGESDPPAPPASESSLITADSA